MKNIVLGNGFIGTILASQLNYDLYGRKHTISDDIDICIVCAPTGNRLQVKNNPDWDLQNVNNIVDKLVDSKPTKTVLIGTVDSLLESSSDYTKNRKLLEDSYKWDHIFRLPTLIHNDIKKNLLYDLQHQKWLHTHNVNSQLQWYCLNSLANDLDLLISQDIRSYNLVSEPIANHVIVKKFFPELLPKLIDHNQNLVQYNIDNSGKYHCNQEFVLQSINNFFRRNHGH